MGGPARAAQECTTVGPLLDSNEINHMENFVNWISTFVPQRHRAG